MSTPNLEIARRFIQAVEQGAASEALRQYQIYARLLASELGIQPAEETSALYEAIKAREISRPPSSAVASALPASGSETPAPPLPPLVARERELRAFEADLARTVAGHCHVRLVAG